MFNKSISVLLIYVHTTMSQNEEFAPIQLGVNDQGCSNASFLSELADSFHGKK